jgi:hypothetical protein
MDDNLTFDNLTDLEKNAFRSSKLIETIEFLDKNNCNSIKCYMMICYFINRSQEFKVVYSNNSDPFKILIFLMLHIYIMYKKKSLEEKNVDKDIEYFVNYIDNLINEIKEEAFDYLNNLNFLERQILYLYLTKDKLKKCIISLLYKVFLDFSEINYDINSTLNIFESIINEYLNKEDKEVIDNLIDSILEDLKNIKILKNILHL